MELKIGCDPEVFVMHTKTKEFICGEGLVPGTKQEPYRVEGGAVQVDGTALEFNIDPASTRVEFVGNVARVFDTLKGMIPKGTEIVTKPVAAFEPRRFKKFSAKALELGCDPDFNAYTGKPNPTPKPPRGSTERTASGHIHVGWASGLDPKDPDHIQICCEVAKQLDWFVGYPSLWFSSPKDEVARRDLYGKAGAFRPKSYGLEYRTPSNAWLKSEKTIAYVYDQTCKAMEEFESGRYMPKHNHHFEISHNINIHYIDHRFFKDWSIAKPPQV